MQSPSVLLSSYAARVISCGAGVRSSLSPFRGCPSGSSELGWGSVELLQTSDVRFSFLNALFILASASTRRFGYSKLCFSVALFPGAGVGCTLLSSRAYDKVSGPSLAPRFAGFTVSAWPTRDNRSGRLLYPVRAVRCSWSAWAAHHQRCKPFMLLQVVAWRRDRRSQSPSGSGCRGHGGAGFWSRNSLFCVPWARCTCAVAPSLLCEELAVILVDGCGCGARARPCEATA